MKKIVSTVLAVVLALSLVGCGSSKPTTTTTDNKTETKLIGVAMPTQSLQRWNQDGSNMKSQLEAKGYKVDLQYSNNDVNTQVQGIENMITKGCKVLVVASIDGSALTDVLKKAGDNGIKVIAYDRLIMKTGNVDYYATFDNFKVGVIQGQYIETKLGLKDGKGPFNIELFGGSPDDNNATFFFNGAMSILQPYPVLTGQDCDKPNVLAMINDQQAMSIFKDTRTLASKVVEMVDAILQGKSADVNDTK